MSQEMEMNQEMDLEEYEKILMKRPGFKEALEETRLEDEIAHTIIGARIEKGLTQAELARLLHTKQSMISRIENGESFPLLRLLKRVADVLDLSLHVEFKPKVKVVDNIKTL